MGTYRNLLVWQRGMELVERIYAFTATLPSDERFGLCTQLQRAAVSIPSNTAEGQSRKRLGAYLNHVTIAIGSQAEIETLLEVCRRLGFGDQKLLVKCVGCAEETGRMLYGLHASLERSSHRRLLYSIFVALAPACWYLSGIL